MKRIGYWLLIIILMLALGYGLLSDGWLLAGFSLMAIVTALVYQRQLTEN